MGWGTEGHRVPDSSVGASLQEERVHPCLGENKTKGLRPQNQEATKGDLVGCRGGWQQEPKTNV